MHITSSLAAAAAAVLALAQPAQAGTWGPARQLMGPFGVSSPPAAPLLVVNAQGRALLAWAGTGAVRLAERQPGGGWTYPGPVPGAEATAGEPALALGRNEVAAVAWTTPATRYTASKLLVSLRLPGGSFGAAVEAAPGTVAGDPKLAVACDGTVTLVWQDAAGLAASELPGIPGSGECNGTPGPGPWTAPQRLSAGSVSLAELASNDAGAALLVWQAGAPGQPSSIVAAERPAGGTWQAPVTLSAPGSGSTWNPKPGLDGAGNAAVGWLENLVMVVARRSAGGAWQAPLALSGTQPAYYPALAMSTRGDLLVAWQGPDARGLGTVWQRSAAPGGAFGTTSRLSTSSEDAGWPTATLSADGTLAGVGWVDNSSNSARAAVFSAGRWTRSTLGGGWWGNTVPLGSGGASAVAGWVVPDGANVNAVLVMGRIWK